MISIRSSIVCGLAMWCGMHATAQDRRSVFEQVPVGAEAVVAIPNLKRANDEFVAVMEGMDRVQLLFGGRPLDQLKLMTGFQSGVDELGGMLVAAVPGADGTLGRLLVVPVTDPEGFFAANFDATDEANRWTHSSGVTMFGRADGAYALLSDDFATFDSYERDPGWLDRLQEAMGPRTMPLLNRGEIIIHGSSAMMQRIVGQMQQQAAEQIDIQRDQIPDLAEANRWMNWLGRVLGQDEMAAALGSLVIINVDPLGLGVHTLTAFDPESSLGRLAAGGTRQRDHFSRLPNRPFYIAASVDVVGMGGIDMAERLVADLFPFPGWLRGVDGMQFGVSPSVLGLQGGLLNEGVVVWETRDPASAVAAMREQIMTPRAPGDEVERTPSWTSRLREIEGIHVDGFEVKATYTTAQALQETIESLVFGRRGFHGLVGTARDLMIVTFSQRPDVFARVLQIGGEARALNENAMVRSIRTWLPPDADLEVFIGVGEIGRLLGQLANNPLLSGLEIPQIDPRTRPVAFGMSVQDGRIETAVVIPADVLTLFIDLGLTQAFRADGAAADMMR